MTHGARRTRAGLALGASGLAAALVGCVLVVAALSGWFGPTGSGDSSGDGSGGKAPSPSQVPRTTAPTGSATSTPRSPSASTFTVAQMNLCLSGMAGCYRSTAYPAVVEEAVARIREVGPDAVTVTEACRRDAVRMARRLGYRVRFARVIYDGAPLPCVAPGGRGLFGDAVLTRAPIVGFRTEAFDVQADLEERRWLCATTRPGVDVCTAHLETPHSRAAAAARDAQCVELATVLAARPTRAFVFGGDVNRFGPCAPAGSWLRADDDADQAPGIQHVYGSSDLRDPTSEVLPAEFSDHDVLVVHATLTPR